MKHAPIPYTIVKRVLNRKEYEYPDWLVQYLKQIEAQPSSEPITGDEVLGRPDETTSSGTTGKRRMTVS